MTKTLIAIPLLGLATTALADTSVIGPAFESGLVIAQAAGDSSGGKSGVGTGPANTGGGMSGQSGAGSQSNTGGSGIGTGNSITGNNSRDTGFSGQGMTRDAHQGGIEQPSDGRGALGRSGTTTNDTMNSNNSQGTLAPTGDREDIRGQNTNTRKGGLGGTTSD